MEHRHAHRDQKADHLAVVGQAVVERGRFGREDGGDAAKLVEQFIDDRAGMRRSQRKQQPF